mmetsp:Transcript_98565/g.306972  ORF Transcript_98565/g.306972 Transcript_98565/m.306972 type:complete len:255 (-) Transcript_98565:357-1121(-)
MGLLHGDGGPDAWRGAGQVAGEQARRAQGDHRQRGIHGLCAALLGPLGGHHGLHRGAARVLRRDGRLLFRHRDRRSRAEPSACDRRAHDLAHVLRLRDVGPRLRADRVQAATAKTGRVDPPCHGPALPPPLVRRRGAHRCLPEPLRWRRTGPRACLHDAVCPHGHRHHCLCLLLLLAGLRRRPLPDERPGLPGSARAGHAHGHQVHHADPLAAARAARRDRCPEGAADGAGHRALAGGVGRGCCLGAERAARGC